MTKRLMGKIDAPRLCISTFTAGSKLLACITATAIIIMHRRENWEGLCLSHQVSIEKAKDKNT
ncbi:MAG: hypothetical protein R6X15_03275 [Pseudomonadota bacterium]